MSTLEEVLRTRRTERRPLPSPAARRLLREQAGLTQEDVAEVLRSQLGDSVDRASVSRWENGKRTPRGAYAKAYRDLLERLAAEEVAT